MNDERDAVADGFGDGRLGPSAYCPLHVATKAGLHGLRVVYCTPHPACRVRFARVSCPWLRFGVIQQGHPRISYRFTLLETTLTS